MSGKNEVHYFKKEESITSGDKPRTLIVDADRRNVKLLEAHLVQLNCQDALGVIRKEEADLVLLDIALPVMDGYTVCRNLKTRESTRMIPVILITALDVIRYHHEKLSGNGYPDGLNLGGERKEKETGVLVKMEP